MLVVLVAIISVEYGFFNSISIFVKILKDFLIVN